MGFPLLQNCIARSLLIPIISYYSFFGAENLKNHKISRFSEVPGSEPIQLDLEKPLLLSDSLENLNFHRKIEISGVYFLFLIIYLISYLLFWGGDMNRR